MEAVKIGGEGSASMATNNRRLSIEDYHDLVKNRDHKLNSYQLRKVISMHGFSGMKVQKSILLDAVKTINLMDLRRSTLKDCSVSGDACLSLASVINDLNCLQWQECHVTSLITQGASATANNDRTVPVNRKKSKGLGKSLVEADDSVISTTNTIDAVSNTTVVKFKRMEDLIKKPVEVAADDSIIPTPGASVDAGSTTVKGKKSNELEKNPVELAADNSIVVSMKRKTWEGLGDKPVQNAADDSTISTESASVAAGGTIVSVKKKRLKGIGMRNSAGCSCC